MFVQLEYHYVAVQHQDQYSDHFIRVSWDTLGFSFAARLISCSTHKQLSNPFCLIMVTEIKAGISPRLE